MEPGRVQYLDYIHRLTLRTGSKMSQFLDGNTINSKQPRDKKFFNYVVIATETNHRLNPVIIELSHRMKLLGLVMDIILGVK